MPPSDQTHLEARGQAELDDVVCRGEPFKAQSMAKKDQCVSQESNGELWQQNSYLEEGELDAGKSILYLSGLIKQIKVSLTVEFSLRVSDSR